jgi:hypothetical protein
MVTTMNRAKLRTDIAHQFDQLRGHLDERARRLYAASESFKVGRGGVRIVSSATGMARSTICAGSARTSCSASCGA